MTIRIKSRIGVAGEYVDVPKEKLHINKIDDFFLCDMLEKLGSKSDADHKPLWLKAEDFAAGQAAEFSITQLQNSSRRARYKYKKPRRSPGLSAFVMLCLVLYC